MTKQLMLKKLKNTPKKKTKSFQCDKKAHNSFRSLNNLPALSELECMFNESENKDMYPSGSTNSNAINYCQEEPVILIEDTQTPHEKFIHQKQNSDKLNLNDIQKKLTSDTDIISIDIEELNNIGRSRKKRSTYEHTNNDDCICLVDEHSDYVVPPKVRKLTSDKCISAISINSNTKSSDESESDTTIIYYDDTNRFSPLPSTSTDIATILENDKSFIKSLYDKVIDTKDVEFIDTNSEDIIVIDDEDIDLPTTSLENRNQTSTSQVNITFTKNDVDLSNVIDCEKDTSKNTTQIPNFSVNEQMIDCVIAENESILTKYLNSPSNVLRILEVEPKQNESLVCTQTNKTVNPASNNQEITCLRSDNTICSLTTRMSKNKEKSNSETSSSLIVSQNCPICLENLRSKDCASTICGHIFCMECIKTALKCQKRCPTCRKYLKNGGYHRLFL